MREASRSEPIGRLVLTLMEYKMGETAARRSSQPYQAAGGSKNNR
jgi:hypothetical protein